MERRPGLRSPRVGQLCNLPGLLASGVKGWPVQCLYFERADRLNVIRLPDERQDIAAILKSNPPPAL